jgi:GntR family transcriptional regulator
MQIWLAKKSDIPVRDQLVTQIVLGILSKDLQPGQRLPSTRQLAGRLRIHPNTVSAAYRVLEEGHWVELRHGSGVFVREPAQERRLPPAFELDRMIGDLFFRAREQGFSLAAVRAHLKHRIQGKLPDHFLVIEPDEHLRAIVVAEIQGATQFTVRGAGLEACRDHKLLRRAVPTVLPSKFENVQALLPPGSDCVALQVRSVPASLSGWIPVPPDALVVVASGWPDFLKWAHTMLVAAGVSPDALEFRATGTPHWKAGLDQATAVVCDTLTASTLPKGCRAIPFPLLSDASLEKLRAVHSFLTRRLE